MLNMSDIMETITMIQEENLDIRTITMGISLIDCADADIHRSCQKVYDKIYTHAKDLVATGEYLEKKYGIPIVNKRISVTPISLLAGVSGGDPVEYARTLDKVAHDVGVNFIGGYSALVQKGFGPGDRELIDSIPRALAETELVCSSVNVGSTKAGINMDAVALMGEKVREAAERTKHNKCIGCAKLVVFCNAVEDNPFMAGAFHGITEADCVLSVGVSGPGVVRAVLSKMPAEATMDEVAETIKKTAFKITRVGQLVGTEAAEMLGVRFGIIDLSLAPTPAIEEGWPDGKLQCGRSVRRFYSGDRGCWYDRRGPEGGFVHREVGGHDCGLLSGSGYDRHPRGYQSGGDRRDHRRRSGHWHGEQQDHGRSGHPRHRCSCRRRTGLRGTAGKWPGDEGPHPVSGEDDPQGRTHPRTHAEPEELEN